MNYDLWKTTPPDPNNINFEGMVGRLIGFYWYQLGNGPVHIEGVCLEADQESCVLEYRGVEKRFYYKDMSYDSR